MTEQETPNDVLINEVINDLAGQVGSAARQTSILMAQLRQLSKQLEEVTEERNKLMAQSRKEPSGESSE